MRIKIRPHADNAKTGYGKNKSSNPEYLINGKPADLKRIFSLDKIESTFVGAIKQGNKIVVFNVMEDLDLKRVLTELEGKMKKYNKPFSKVYVINKGVVTEL